MPDESQAVTIRFQLSKSDVYWALVQNNFRLAWVFALIVALILLQPLIASPESTIDRNFISNVIPSVALVVFLFLALPYIGARNTMKSPTFRGPLEYTFSDAGILSKGMHASSQSDWPLIKRVSESSRFVFVRTVQNHFHIIPKAQVSAADLATLKSILRTCVKGKVKLKP
jgi:hypothetical protein